MEEERDAFYVVRKGDIVGVYKSLSECQAQTGSSVCNPSVSVYKGYNLPKEAEEYLGSHGLKNSCYAIAAAHVKDDLFGDLVACPFQQPTSYSGKALNKDSPAKRLHEVLEPGKVMENAPQNAPLCSCGCGPMRSLMSKTSKNHGRWFYRCPEREDHPGGFIWVDECVSQQSKVMHHEVQQPLHGVGVGGEVAGSMSLSTSPLRKHLKLDNGIESEAASNCYSCILEFDGASKGNPGQAGAGAVLRAENGNMVCRLREGVGIATNNVAEYRALILGLKCALKKGFKHIHARGDSKLVCQQIQGLWKIKNQNMADLCTVAKELVKKFTSFQIDHVLREFNSEADAQANLAVNLKDGQVEEDCSK